MVDSIGILSVCSGVGMLDLGVHAALEFLGLRPHVLGYCERDAYASSVLMARMEDASMERAPIWCGDLRGLDARPMLGHCDLIVAGLPCQPYSVAGKQEGITDARSFGEDGEGPLPHFLRIVEECRPALVFLENVPPWVRGGFFRPFGDQLCRMGYSILEPVFVAASEVGASHRRERVFVMAHCDQSGRVEAIASAAGRRQDVERHDEAMANALRSERQPRARRQRVFNDGATVGDAGSSHVHGCQSKQQQGKRPAGAGEGLADAGSERLQRIVSDRAETRPVERGDGTTLFAPGPSDPRWPAILRDSPHLAPAIESGVRVLADGNALVVDSERTDQLRCIGNGCTPEQAAVAFVELFRRLTADC